ncbi:MAG: SurA N-terminal domain-containing protein [Fibrobacterales bacterium]
MRNLLLILSVLSLIGCQTPGGYGVDELETMASALRQQELYRASIEVYESLLNNHTLENKKRANVLYQIATIQKDNLADYKGALASYTKIKAIAPKEKFNGNLNKYMVLCLERLGRSLDASQQVSEVVTLNKKVEPVSGTVVAEIGDQKITLEEVENTFGKLPEESIKKQQMAQNYIGTILAARAARRKGLAEVPEIKQQIAQLETQILAQATIKEELKDVTVVESDVINFYNANKAQYGDTVSYDQVKQKVHQDYMMQKQNVLVSQYIDKLLKADDVKLYMDKIK